MATSFLRVRRGRYDFRRRVPSDLVSFVGKREIVHSLGSLSHAEAVRQARRLAVETDELFAEMSKKKPNLTSGRITDLAADWFSRRVAHQDEALAKFVPNDPEQLDRVQRQAERRLEGATNLLTLNDYVAYTDTVEALLEAHGLASDRDSSAFRELCRAVMRAEIEAARDFERKVRGDFTAPPGDPLVTANAAQPAPSQPSGTRPAPKLSDAWATYSEAKARGGFWRADMEADAEQASALFVEVLGDRRIDLYSRADVSEFAQLLQHLPAHRTKKPAFRGKSLSELAAMTKADPKIAVLNPRTVKKYVGIVSSFLEWSTDQGLISRNVAKGVYKTPRRTVRRSDERNAWTIEQLQKLFDSPLYSGSKSEARRSEPGSVVVKDARYWLPILALFHPCRREELCQLRVSDLKTENGILFMDIRTSDDDDESDAPARRLKSAAAIRAVPIHKTVLELGFGSYIAERQRKGDTMLFPELKPGGTGQKLGANFGKWFQRHRDATGIRGVDFHSFRHNAVTQLVRAGVHGDVVNQLDGHEVAGERGRYSKGADLSGLKLAIDMIAYPGLRLDHLKP